MNEKKFAVKIKRYAVLGISLLGLAAIGCGGGSGTLVSDPTVLIGNGAVQSLQTVGGASKATSKITGKTTVQVYSLDGELYDAFTQTNVDLPATIGISGALAEKARDQNALVFRVFNATHDYTTVVALSRADLATNGPIQENGNTRTEPADEGSTVRAALIEAELERETGVPVRLATKSSGSVKAQLKAAVESADNGIAVDELASTLKAAAASNTSVLAQVIGSVEGTLSNTDTVNSRDAIRTFLSTGRNKTSSATADAGTLTRLKKARKLMQVSAKLSKQVRKLSASTTRQTKVRTFLSQLAEANDAGIDAASAGANVVADALSLTQKASNQTTLVASINDLVDNASDLSAAVSKAATEVLPKLTGDVAADLANKDGVEDLAGLVGGVLSGSSTDANKAAALGALDTALQVIPGASAKNKIIGGALAASVTNAEAAGLVLGKAAGINATLATSDSVDVGEAIRAVAGSSNAGDLVVVVSEAIAALGGQVETIKAAFLSGKASVDSLVGAIGSDLAGADLLLIKDQATGLSANAIVDAPKIVGQGNVKTGDTVVLSNDSIETQNGTYKYEWTVPAAAANGAVSKDDQGQTVTFTASNTAGSYAISLSQTYNGTVTKTATFTLVISDTLAPVVVLGTDELTIKAGQRGAINVAIADPELGRTLSVTATVGATCGQNDTGFVAGDLTSAGGSLTVEVDASVSAGTYCGRVTVEPSNATALTKDFDVVVPAVAATKILISGVRNVIEGTALTISALAVQEQAVAAGAMLKLFINTDGSTAGTPDATAALTAGFTSVSETVTLTVAGKYTVTAQVVNGATTVTETADFQVDAAGVPTMKTVHVGATKVNLDDVNATIPYVVSSLPLSLDIHAVATSTTGITTYAVYVDEAPAAGNTTGTTMTISLDVVGKYKIGVGAANATGEVVRTFNVNVTQSKSVTVNSVALTGQSVSGALTTTVANDIFVADASGITGLDLNNSNGLIFSVEVAANTVTGNDFQIFVKLTDENDANRLAELTVTNAVLISSGGGYDITTSATVTTGLQFVGVRADGSSARFNTNAASNSYFDSMFSASSTGIDVNINYLKLGMIEALEDAGFGYFTSSIENMTGSDLTLELKITSKNFSFIHGTDEFNIFKITGISVQ